jgi:2-polyprenyl-6-methoxyphenol hydroxylase-like FAD-dependent oxidoreductase
MAIEDSVVLAQCLRQDMNVNAALMNFAKRRFPRTRAIVETSYRMGKMGQRESRAACWLRDNLVRIALPLLRARSIPDYSAFDVGPIF